MVGSAHSTRSAVLMVGSDSDRLQGESRGRTNQKFIARFMFNKPLKKRSSGRARLFGSCFFFSTDGMPLQLFRDQNG